ncbi:MAG: hypothetical protein RL701_978 [Pseudomonadota bacterium]
MSGSLPLLRLVAFGVLLCTAVVAGRGHAEAAYTEPVRSSASVTATAEQFQQGQQVQQDRAAASSSDGTDSQGDSGSSHGSHGATDPSEPTELGEGGADDFDSFEDVMFFSRLYVDIVASAESREHAAIEDARVHARLEDRRCDRPPRA